MLLCVFYSPKSSTVVLASFCWALSDFSLFQFGDPPNMVTWVHPGPKLKAVAVCDIRGCAPSGRVSWGEGESWVDIDKLLKRSDIITSWIMMLFWGTILGSSWDPNKNFCQTLLPLSHLNPQAEEQGQRRKKGKVNPLRQLVYILG